MLLIKRIFNHSLFKLFLMRLDYMNFLMWVGFLAKLPAFIDSNNLGKPKAIWKVFTIRSMCLKKLEDYKLILNFLINILKVKLHKYNFALPTKERILLIKFTWLLIIKIFLASKLKILIFPFYLDKQFLKNWR